MLLKEFISLPKGNHIPCIEKAESILEFENNRLIVIFGRDFRMEYQAALPLQSNTSLTEGIDTHAYVIRKAENTDFPKTLQEEFVQQFVRYSDKKMRCYFQLFPSSIHCINIARDGSCTSSLLFREVFETTVKRMIENMECDLPFILLDITLVNILVRLHRKWV